MSGWEDIVSSTSSRIKRGRFATSTFIFSTVRSPGERVQRGSEGEQAPLRGRLLYRFPAKGNTTGTNKGGRAGTRQVPHLVILNLRAVMAFVRVPLRPLV